MRCVLPALVLLVLTSVGCATARPAPAYAVTALAGGASGPGLLHAGRWYQAAGTDLLVMDPADGAERGRGTVGAAGGAGPIVALAVIDGALHAVSRDEAVLRFDTSDPDRPAVAARTDARALGVRPRTFAITRDGVFVAGVGGVRAWPDGAATWTTPENVTSVVASASGLIATVGRRAYVLPDGAYVGSASRLVALPPGGALPGSFAFVRDGAAWSAVGLMTDHVREIDARASTVTVPGRVGAIVPTGNALWTAGEVGVRRFVGSNDGLTLDLDLPVTGARTVVPLDDGALGIAGAFGCGVREATEDGAWRRLVRAPGGVRAAAFDGRRLLMDTASGRRVYVPGAARAAASDDDRPLPDRPARTATTLWCTAVVADDSAGVTVTTAQGSGMWSLPSGGGVDCVAAIDGMIWVGHADGITVLAGRGADPVAVHATLPLTGPIPFLFPLVSGGAVFAGEAGAGTVRPR